MNKKEIIGYKNVMRALLDGRRLVSEDGLVMSLRGGFLQVFEAGKELNLDLDSTKFTYDLPVLKAGGEYTTRSGYRVVLSPAPKSYLFPWAGLVFCDNKVEAALYHCDGTIYSHEEHPFDIVGDCI